ncbi:hypothetical protein AB0C81_26670 [Streptomyces roseoverticillatus]|uniref:hypothetical protein n=1 Tax=Streptomyces roseoverticillatus TaxID=66429 RepID=UPI0033BFE1FF
MDSTTFSQTHGAPFSWSAADYEVCQNLASLNPPAPVAPVALLVPLRGGGRIAVQARRTVADGLLAHRAIGLPSWRLTHHSGRMIAGFEHQWQAFVAAAYLACLTDWTHSPSALRADTAAVIADIDAGVRKAGGVLLVTPGGVADRMLRVGRVLSPVA